MSSKQRRKMAVLRKQGKITEAQWEKFKVVKPKRKGRKSRGKRKD